MKAYIWNGDFMCFFSFQNEVRAMQSFVFCETEWCDTHVENAVAFCKWQCHLCASGIALVGVQAPVLKCVSAQVCRATRSVCLSRVGQWAFWCWCVGLRGGWDFFVCRGNTDMENLCKACGSYTQILVCLGWSHSALCLLRPYYKTPATFCLKGCLRIPSRKQSSKLVYNVLFFL